MRYRVTLSIALSVLCGTVVSDELQRQDQLVWDYAEFTQEFSARNWSRAARFVAPETKIGFGGDAGLDGMVQVFGGDDGCHKAMVQALELGCRKLGDGDNMRCVSPPYLGQDVIYLGARASFQYSVENGRWMLEFLVCGGD